MPADRDPAHAAAGAPSGPLGGPLGEAPESAPHDPLRLCTFATIALLGWLGGAVTLLFFAVVGFVGYVRARRGGLRISQCLLRDTRLVLVYLGVLGILAGWGLWIQVA